ncbi:MAG: flagellar export protein FliJ [Clostridiales bacterium]|jgi:flagellar FliJ protein|nr:flagellar export protein FliJ [Clostridiales bacterium]
MPFKFRLQSYLSLKEKMEDLRKQEYGRAARDYESEKRSLAVLEQEKALSMGLFRESLSPGQSGLNPGELNRYNVFLDRVSSMIKDQAVKVKAAQEEVEKKRAALAEAMKDRKMLDTLKDNQKLENDKEELAAEQKAADELVSFRSSAK